MTSLPQSSNSVLAKSHHSSLWVASSCATHEACLLEYSLSSFEMPLNLQVYTFAGPRAGNYTFTAYIANCFPGKVFRLVHSSDTVPKVSCTLP